MEVHQLRYFVAAAEALSITRAAERVHVSQPALSRQIAALEEELGVALFDRIKKRIHLTEAGRFFLERARRILNEIESSAIAVQERYGEARRTVRLGFLTPFLDDLVTPAVIALRKVAPRLDVQLQELDARAQIDQLRDGTLDLAVLGNIEPEDQETYGWHSVHQSPMALILPEDHPRATAAALDLSEFAETAFVSLSDAFFPGRRQFLDEICKKASFHPQVARECDSIPLMLGCVAAGEGIGLLPTHAQKLPHAGTVFVPMRTPEAHADIIALYRNEALCADLAALIEALKNTGASLQK